VMADEYPEAGDEWTTKALLLGAELKIDFSVWGVLWQASIPGHGMYFGTTPARASRRLVRSIIGDII